MLNHSKNSSDFASLGWFAYRSCLVVYRRLSEDRSMSRQGFTGKVGFGSFMMPVGLAYLVARRLCFPTMSGPRRHEKHREESGSMSNFNVLPPSQQVLSPEISADFQQSRSRKSQMFTPSRLADPNPRWTAPVLNSNSSSKTKTWMKDALDSLRD